MTNSISPQFSHSRRPQRLRSRSVQQTQRVVRQDNPAPSPAPPGSPEPAPRKKDARTAPNKGDTKYTHHKSRSAKDVQLNLWVEPSLKEELERVAKREGISISAAGEAFLEKALQQNLHTQHAALLDPIIHKAIAKQMRSYSTRIAVLLVRVAFASEQTRSLVTNILSRQPGVDTKTLTQILDSSSNAAKGKITYQTPQLETILAEVEKWFIEKEVQTQT